jgi:hypothetical protein
MDLEGLSSVRRRLAETMWNGCIVLHTMLAIGMETQLFWSLQLVVVDSPLCDSQINFGNGILDGQVCRFEVRTHHRAKSNKTQPAEGDSVGTILTVLLAVAHPLLFSYDSVANVSSGNHRIFSVVVAAYLTVFYTLHLLSKEYAWYTEMRHKFLSQRLLRNYTIYVSGIPPQYRNSFALREYFTNCSWNSAVVEAHIAMDIPKLESKVARREAVIQSLEHVMEQERIQGKTQMHYVMKKKKKLASSSRTSSDTSVATKRWNMKNSGKFTSDTSVETTASGQPRVCGSVSDTSVSNGSTFTRTSGMAIPGVIEKVESVEMYQEELIQLNHEISLAIGRMHNFNHRLRHHMMKSVASSNVLRQRRVLHAPSSHTITPKSRSLFHRTNVMQDIILDLSPLQSEDSEVDGVNKGAMSMEEAGRSPPTSPLPLRIMRPIGLAKEISLRTVATAVSNLSGGQGHSQRMIETFDATMDGENNSHVVHKHLNSDEEDTSFTNNSDFYVSTTLSNLNLSGGPEHAPHIIEVLDASTSGDSNNLTIDTATTHNDMHSQLDEEDLTFTHFSDFDDVATSSGPNLENDTSEPTASLPHLIPIPQPPPSPSDDIPDRAPLLPTLRLAYVRQESPPHPFLQLSEYGAEEGHCRPFDDTALIIGLPEQQEQQEIIDAILDSCQTDEEYEAAVLNLPYVLSEEEVIFFRASEFEDDDDSEDETTRSSQKDDDEGSDEDEHDVENGSLSLTSLAECKIPLAIMRRPSFEKKDSRNSSLGVDSESSVPQSDSSKSKSRRFLSRKDATTFSGSKSPQRLLRTDSSASPSDSRKVRRRLNLRDPMGNTAEMLGKRVMSGRRLLGDAGRTSKDTLKKGFEAVGNNADMVVGGLRKVTDAVADAGLTSVKKVAELGEKMQYPDNFLGATLAEGRAFVTESAAVVAPRLLRHLGDGQPREAGFVVFRDLYTTQAARQMLQHPSANQMVVEPAPSPEDIFWRNVGLSAKARSSGRLMSLAATIALCLFWSLPSAVRSVFVHFSVRCRATVKDYYKLLVWS